MRMALRMAKRGLGHTGANPAVGAVIVDEAKAVVIARGWTQPDGRPHAETNALDRAGPSARGATMYVTLEPCSHFGQTPPCADALIASGIARTVIGVEDPDLRVSGRGIARLRDAGVAVDVGVLADDCRRMTIGHIRRVTRNRPSVQIKLAVGSDAFVPRGRDGHPVWITSEAARARAHLLRARADAILVGIGTAHADDPELTCRLPGLSGRSPLRVILDTSFALKRSTRIMKTAATVPVMIFTSTETAQAHSAFPVGGRIEVVGVSRGADGQGLDLSQVLQVLAGRGITRLLVEGGPKVAAAFIAGGYADECVIMRGAVAVGSTHGSPAFGADGLECITANADWRLLSREAVTGDMIEHYWFEGQKPMFTGLVTDIGEVVRNEAGRITIRSSYLPASIMTGASICCDGCCLTVTGVRAERQNSEFSVDVSNETLSKTTLGGWQPGTKVNLERSLKAGDELGGHVVSGHVDGVASIIEVKADGGSQRFTLEVGEDLAKFIAPKGSIALDGTSLTVNEVNGNRFGVNLIPHSLGATTWGRKQAGDRVNLEVDMFARYVARLMEFRR